MRRSLARILALPVAAVGIAAGTAAAVPAASAATLTTTGGSVALTFPDSYITQLAKAGVVEFPRPLSDLSADTTNQTVTATFNVTGGDGYVNVFYGQVDMAGSIEIVAKNGKTLTLNNLVLDIHAGDIVGTPAGSTTPVALWDVRSNTATWTGTVPANSTFTDTLNSANLAVDPAGATYLDNALCTTAFVAGQTAGTMAATWTDNYS